MIKGLLLLVVVVRLTASDTQNGGLVPPAGEPFTGRNYNQYREVARAANAGSSNVNNEIRKPTAARAFVNFEATFQSPDADLGKKRLAEILAFDPTQKKTEQQDAEQFSGAESFTLKDDDEMKIPSVSFQSESEEPQRNIVDLATVLEVEKYLKSRPELPTLSREDIIHYIQNISESGGSDFESTTGSGSAKVHTFHNTKWTIPEKNTNSKADDEPVMLVYPENFVNESDAESARTERPFTETSDEKEIWYAEAWEEKVPEGGSTKSFGKNQPSSESKFYGYPVYKADTAESSADFTYATARSYASYDNPEMVTKSSTFQVAEEYENVQKPLNHRHDEELPAEDATEKLGDGVNAAIIVLPSRDNTYNAKPGETSELDDSQGKKEHGTTGGWKATSSPVYVTPAKTVESSPKEEIEMSAERPASGVDDVEIAESLENFGLDDAKTDRDSDITKGEKPSLDEAQSKRKKLIKPKGTKSKAATLKNSGSGNDLLRIVETLPEDMKILLENLNLGNGTVEEKEPLRDDARRQPQPSIDPSSFSRFKPLPMARNWGDGKRKTLNDEMKEFLASFGLVPEDDTNGGRQRKSYTEKKEMRYLDAVPQVNMDIIPEDMRHVVYNLGLANRGQERQSAADHIFNPSNHLVNQSREEMEKLKALMAMVKKVASSNDSEPASAELQAEMSRQMKELSRLPAKYANEQTTDINNEIKQVIMANQEKFDFTRPRNFTEHQRERKSLDLGFDPVFAAETSRAKKEVKRQASDSASGMEVGSNSTEGMPLTATATPNIEGLKESFGGGETAPDDADVDSALPPKKPNGLYLLVDWNSFLEVGTEDDKRRVNIRFQPKIGDGRHFIPVSVP